MLSNDRLPIIIASTDGMVKKASNQAGIIFNMRDELISTQSIANLIDFENDDVKDKVLGFINQGVGVYQDTFLIRPEGKETIEYVILIAPVFDSGDLHSVLIF